MNMRKSCFPLLLLAAACASSSAMPGAKIPKPKVQIIARTNLSEAMPTMATGIAVHYELRITNVAEVPVTLTRADLDERLHRAAEVQLSAHLIKLREEGKVSS